MDSTRYKIFSIEHGDHGTVAEKELQRLEMFYRRQRADILDKVQGLEANNQDIKSLLVQIGELDLELRKVDHFKITNRSQII